MSFKISFFLILLFISLPTKSESFFIWFNDNSVFKKRFINDENVLPHSFVNLNLLESSTPSLNYYSYQLDKNNLPIDLALVPLIESANNPAAKSPKHALGLWQFMPNTAKEFGLISKDKKDFRKNVIHSTEVAMDYFKYLHGQLGDWNLVLIAYNWGIGSVKKQLKNNLLVNGKINFKKIPTETQKYLINFYHLKDLINKNSSSNYLKKYPLGDYFKKQPMSDWLETYQNSSSDKNINTKVLERINGFDPFKANNYEYVLMPTNLFQKFFSLKEAGKNYKRSRLIRKCNHKTKYNETFDSIAKKYKVSVDYLKDLNPTIFSLRPNLVMNVCR